MKNPLFVSIPHSGEVVPKEAHWLQGLEEPTLMRDVDRYVDELYREAIAKNELPAVLSEIHRYAADLNRIPADVDASSVEGAPSPAGMHPTGFHWVVTTIGEVLMPEPISMELHDLLVDKYWKPFHDQVASLYRNLGVGKERPVFQIDAHSMPSKGTNKHRDPGETRAEVVVSDQEGSSCVAEFKELVVQAYREAGFQVKINWPYFGGRVTQTYGKPSIGQNCIQVELNRAMYMNEETKQRLGAEFEHVREGIGKAFDKIVEQIDSI